MSNTLLTISKITNEALMVLENELTYPQAIIEGRRPSFPEPSLEA